MKKNEKTGLGPSKIPLNSKSDLDHWLDIKKYQRFRFSIYLLLSLFKSIHVLVEVCTLRMLFENYICLLVVTRNYESKFGYQRWSDLQLISTLITLLTQVSLSLL